MRNNRISAVKLTLLSAVPCSRVDLIPCCKDGRGGWVHSQCDPGRCFPDFAAVQYHAPHPEEILVASLLVDGRSTSNLFKRGVRPAVAVLVCDIASGAVNYLDLGSTARQNGFQGQPGRDG